MDMNSSENKFQEQLVKSLNEPIRLPLNDLFKVKHSDELEEIKKLIEKHTKELNEIKSILEKLNHLVEEMSKQKRSKKEKSSKKDPWLNKIFKSD
ncbi:hypothetical protein [Bacillus cereus group sp. N21]|uniref:hypothetical protein n=1 Tax=Bacillus cereus group sp. N21 TaxID=2794591 RepID=UPI0018F4348C|nr:hypothetical protein [Bacillus cereus group sp. N21]MBJ8031737.1 hypothetical protein [Bacillus cereus group sp. N21]